MIKINKIFFLIIKSILALAALLILILFFYAGFFYNPSVVEKKKTDDQIIKNEKKSNIEDDEKEEILEKKSNETKLESTKKIKKIKTTIEDGLYATVGSTAITKSDIVNEIKLILILSNKTYSDDEAQKLQQMAIKSIIKRSIKRIEIEKNDYLQFNDEDLKNELIRLAKNININLDTLKDIFSSNDLDFIILENQIKTDLLWNSLIFQIYKNRIQINLEEIDEQLKLIQTKKEINEYLISEIVINNVEKDILQSTIEELESKIKTEGFESVAVSLSISNSGPRGGDLGWINENIISKKLLSTIKNTDIGQISKPVILPNGILVFKVRNKRIIEKEINLEEAKNQLVNSEKERILNMHSSSHYNNLRRSISIKFF